MTSNLELTADVVASYAANHEISPSEVGVIIRSVHEALSQLGQEPTQAKGRPTKAQIKRSIQADAITSFEDGRPYKQLRRHLSRLGLTPEAYRQKWGLPADYPMTAPEYSERRSAMAKAAGLGRKVRKASADAAKDAAARVMDAAGEAAVRAAPAAKRAASRAGAAAASLAGELADKAGEVAADAAHNAAEKAAAKAKQIVKGGAEAIADALSTNKASPTPRRRGRPPRAKG